MRVTAYYLSFLCLVFGAGGCGPDAEQRVPVAGTVLIDGQPLTSGTIRFVPEVGRPASSAIMADGSFELASDSVNRVSALGIPRGDYRVQVSALQVVDDETIRWNAPEMYADFRTSGLDVTIDRPTDDLVIELTWGDALSPDEDDDSKTAEAASDTEGEPPRAAPSGAPATGSQSEGF